MSRAYVCDWCTFVLRRGIGSHMFYILRLIGSDSKDGEEGDFHICEKCFQGRLGNKLVV